MYIINGIAYAGKTDSEIKVKDFNIVDDMMMLVTFDTGEKRVFDATVLLEYPAFKPLENDDVFRSAKVDYGVLTWLEGNIDIAPETLYKKCYAYPEA